MVQEQYSTNDGPECVEVAATPHTVHIRDSKSTPGPRLAFTPDRWTAFVTFAATSSPS